MTDTTMTGTGMADTTMRLVRTDVLPAQPADPRLTTDQVASFVANGFLRLEAVVPDDINEQAMTELPQLFNEWLAQLIGTPRDESRPSMTQRSGTSMSLAYSGDSAIGRMLAVPEIAGAVASLVGTAAVFDHHFAHLKPPHDPSAQLLHCDAIVDPNTAFDIQLFWYPHDVAPGAGGTRFVPGSHLRRATASDVARYQHIVGEQFYSGPAGTVVIFHHGLWHAGAANDSDQLRVMGKVRINPTQPQVRLWDTSDLDARNARDEHVFAVTDSMSVASILRQRQPWYSEQVYRHELVQRAKLWRYLSGDEQFDLDWYLTRQETRSRLQGPS